MFSNSYWGVATQFVLIQILITVVVGAFLVWIIKYVWNPRLTNLLRILVVLFCLAAILRQLLLLFGVGI
jgi:hypothetical protein